MSKIKEDQPRTGIQMLTPNSMTYQSASKRQKFTENQTYDQSQIFKNLPKKLNEIQDN
jgi:hypothetical protein